MKYVSYDGKLKIGNQEFDVVKWEVNNPTINDERDFLHFGNFSGVNFNIEAVSSYPFPKNGVISLEIQEFCEDFHFYTEDKYVEYDNSDWWWLEKYGYGFIEKKKVNNTFTAKEVRIIIESNDTKHIEPRFLKREVRHSLRSYP